MIKKVTIYSGILAVVFAAVGCIGDNIEALYSVCMGICIASLIVFIAGLFRMEYAARETDDIRVIAKEKRSLKRTA